MELSIPYESHKPGGVWGLGLEFLINNQAFLAIIDSGDPEYKIRIDERTANMVQIERFKKGKPLEEDDFLILGYLISA